MSVDIPRVARRNQPPTKRAIEKFPTGVCVVQISSELISPDASASSSTDSSVHSGDSMGADLRGLFSRDMLAVEQRIGVGASRRVGGRCPESD